jgi:hypothetical protein
MDILAKKMSFVQEFLRISDEELIDKLESLLRTERKKRLKINIQPITMDKFTAMIEKSEDDFNKGRVTEAKEILTRIDAWE